MNNDKVTIKKFDSSKIFKICYENENEFNKLIKSLKVYNMLAYKEFVFDIMYKLRSGSIVGELVDDNIYKCYLSSSKIFEYVYGKTYFTYRLDGNRVTILNMEPNKILSEGHSKKLEAYRGVPISSPRDKFKVDLYYSLKK